MAAIKLRGHEKFYLREGWITKGLVGVSENPRIFSEGIGPDRLGVGTNMVRSIRYWMLAFGLTSESPKNGAALTEFGKLIEEYDLYLEDYFTLWLLHSHIAKNASHATVWYLFYNCCDMEEFTKDELLEVLKKELVAYAETDKFSESSLKEDMDALLSMYGREFDVESPEEKKHCPLAALNLLKREQDTYYRMQPDVRHFQDEVVLYELSMMLEDQSSVSIDEIAELAKGIYHLSKVTLNTILDRLDNAGYIRVDRTAGLDVVYANNMKKPMDVAADYYKR